MLCLISVFQLFEVKDVDTVPKTYVE